MKVLQRVAFLVLLVAVVAGVRVQAFTDPRVAFVSAWESTCVDGIGVAQDSPYPAAQDAEWYITCSCANGDCLSSYAEFCSEADELAEDYCGTYYCGVSGLASGCDSNFEDWMDWGNKCLYCEI